MQVQELLAELAMAEEEILWLERKIDELKLSLYQERKQTKEWKIQQQRQRKLRQQNHLPPCGRRTRSVLEDDFHKGSRSQHHEEFRKEKMKYRRASVGSATEILSIFDTGTSSKLLISHSKQCLQRNILSLFTFRPS